MRKTAMWTPLQSKGWFVWRILVSKIRKVEDTTIQKSEHREEVTLVRQGSGTKWTVAQGRG
jgi:hypothetical protein